MRIEKLPGDKIKVTLSTTDLVKLDIDINDLSPNSETLHSFLFHIMETVREETGFNPYNGQVVVEATPSREGISIVVSKVNNGVRKITKEDLKRNVQVKAKSKRADTSAAIFYFADFDDLCAALCNLNYDELVTGAVYKLSGTFCFVLAFPQRFARCVSVMSEFSAHGSKYPLQLTYIKEHGSLIAEGKALVNMTENIRNLV